MKKFRKLNEILAQKDIEISELKEKLTMNDTGHTELAQKYGKDFDLVSSVSNRDREMEQLQIANIHLQKNYEREKQLVEQKVRELEEFQAQMYDDTYREK